MQNNLVSFKIPAELGTGHLFSINPNSAPYNGLKKVK
jgi:hypothetical protein